MEEGRERDGETRKKRERESLREEIGEKGERRGSERTRVRESKGKRYLTHYTLSSDKEAHYNVYT